MLDIVLIALIACMTLLALAGSHDYLMNRGWLHAGDPAELAVKLAWQAGLLLLLLLPAAMLVLLFFMAIARDYLTDSF